MVAAISISSWVKCNSSHCACPNGVGCVIKSLNIRTKLQCKGIEVRAALSFDNACWADVSKQWVANVRKNVEVVAGCHNNMLDNSLWKPAKRHAMNG